jgi:prophage antirepressor-like protein
MNMEMEVFENTEFGAIRTIVDENGNVLFCGSDAAKALGYQRPQNAIRTHCRRYALKRGIPHPQNPDKTIEMLFISEPDLYRLIAHSQLPAAQQFEAWIYETVLPSIRKHGAYITPQTLDQLIANPSSASRLFHELKQMRTSVAEMTPKAAYFDALVDTSVLSGIRLTAKELKLPEKLFTYLLVEMGFAYRTPKKLLMPYAFMVTSGFAELKEYTRNGHGGVYMLFTPKGRLYLARRIEKRLALKSKE